MTLVSYKCLIIKLKKGDSNIIFKKLFLLVLPLMFIMLFFFRLSKTYISAIALFGEKSFPIQTNQGVLTVAGAEFGKVNLRNDIYEII